MLEINMDDVIAVIQSITPQLIAVAVALMLGIIVTIAINKKTVTNQGMRKLVRCSDCGNRIDLHGPDRSA